MKSGDGITFNNAIRIYQIRTQSQTDANVQPNQNYEEFKSVYSGILRSKKSYVKDVKVRPQRNNFSPRPKVEIKTVKMDVPAFGTENAIVRPKDRASVYSTGCLKPILKNKISKDKCISTQDIVRKTKIDKRSSEKKMSKPELKRTPTVFLDRTTRELDHAGKKLEELKNKINRQEEERQNKTVKRQRSPVFRPKGKSRHGECVNKKYVATLNTIEQQLQRLEEKYFSKPKIPYRSVTDTSTQASNVEVLYENTKYPEDVKMDEALRSIVDDIDDLVHVDTDKPLKPRERSLQMALNARDLTAEEQEIQRNPKTFVKRESTSEEQKLYPKMKGTDERNLKKCEEIQREVFDVEAFCQKLCSLGKDSDMDLNNQQDDAVSGQKTVVKFDVDEFCQQLSKLTDNSEKSSNRAERKGVIEWKGLEEREHKKKEMDEKAPISSERSSRLDDNNALQKCLLKSSYLMKEFKIDHGLNEGGEKASSDKKYQRRFKDMSDRRKERERHNKNITDLINSLSSALENSIYSSVEI